MRRSLGLVGFAVLLACTHGERPPGGRAAPDATIPPQDAEPPATPSPWRAHLSTDVRLPDGTRLRIATEQGADKSVLWAQKLADADAPAGPATELREVPGEIEGVGAAVDGQTVWVVWRERSAGGRAQTNRLERFSLDLAAHGAAPSQPGLTRTLAAFEGLDSGGNAIVVRSRGAKGIAVAAFVGRRECQGMQPEAPTTCQGLQVDLVGADGNASRVETRWLEGGDGDVDDVLATDIGVLVAMHAYVGGPMTEVTFVPDDAAAPVIALESCGYPTIDLALVDTSVISLCPDPDATSDGLQLGCRANAADDSCGLLTRVGLPGAPASKNSGVLRLQSIEARCDGKAPLVHLQWNASESEPATGLDVPAAMLGWGSSQTCP